MTRYRKQTVCAFVFLISSYCFATENIIQRSLFEAWASRSLVGWVSLTCLPGQEQVAEDVCCWEGQAWDGKTCVGLPSYCPEGYTRTEDSCYLKNCLYGTVRQIDGIHCCFPGQVWHKERERCVGKPKACPDHYKLRTDLGIDFSEICLLDPYMHSSSYNERKRCWTYYTRPLNYDSKYKTLPLVLPENGIKQILHYTGSIEIDYKGESAIIIDLYDYTKHLQVYFKGYADASVDFTSTTGTYWTCSRNW